MNTLPPCPRIDCVVPIVHWHEDARHATAVWKVNACQLSLDGGECPHPRDADRDDNCYAPRVTTKPEPAGTPVTWRSDGTGLTLDELGAALRNGRQARLVEYWPWGEVVRRGQLSSTPGSWLLGNGLVCTLGSGGQLRVPMPSTGREITVWVTPDPDWVTTANDITFPDSDELRGQVLTIVESDKSDEDRAVTWRRKSGEGPTLSTDSLLNPEHGAPIILVRRDGTTTIGANPASDAP